MKSGVKKKKITRRHSQSGKTASSSNTSVNSSLPDGLTKLEPDKTVQTNREIFIKAPASKCFDAIRNRLEHALIWDMVIFKASPVSSSMRQVGAESQVSFNFGGKEINARAFIFLYRPNSSISWVLGGSPKIKEEWKFKSKSGGTLVQLNFACELGGNIINRIILRVFYWKKLQRDLNLTLSSLKSIIENGKR
jgi:hypothetical protein